MRAVWLTTFGEPEVLVPRETPDPTAGPGQVVIDVSFVNITFVETQFRAAGIGPFRSQPPTIPGNGVSGVITMVGPDVDGHLLGTRVVSSTGGFGAYAERVAVDARAPIRVPDALELDAATALLADGRTAMMMVEAGGLRPGETALVMAAGGGVGTLLVQLAKTAGARVVAAAGAASKLKVARELGADIDVNYRNPEWVTQTLHAAGEIDVVFDAVGGKLGDAAVNALRRGGRILCFGSASGRAADISPEVAANRGITVVHPEFALDKMRTYTERALQEGANGRLRPVIGQRFELEAAASAHRAIQSRATLGKTLLVVS